MKFNRAFSWEHAHSPTTAPTRILICSPQMFIAFKMARGKHTVTSNCCATLLHPDEIPYKHAGYASASHLGMLPCLERENVSG